MLQSKQGVFSDSHDSGIIWNDKHLNIEWPCESPILSDKDKTHSTFVDFIERQNTK